MCQQTAPSSIPTESPMSKAYLVKSFLLLCCLAPLTGCMMGPTDQTVIYSFDHEFKPFGFTVIPGERVELQALLPGPRPHWITFAETNTKCLSMRGYGHDWYHWDFPNTKIPSWAWTKHSASTSTAEIRAIGAKTSTQVGSERRNPAFFTFNSNLYDVLDPGAGPGGLEELASQCALHKRSVTIVCQSAN